MQLQVKARYDTYTITLPLDLKQRLQELRALADGADIDFNATLAPSLHEFCDALEEYLTSPDRPIHTPTTSTNPTIRRRRRRTDISEQPPVTTSRLEDLVPPNPSAATSIAANGSDNTNNEPLET